MLQIPVQERGLARLIPFYIIHDLLTLPLTGRGLTIKETLDTPHHPMINAPLFHGPQLHGRQWPKIRDVQHHLFPVAAAKKQHGRGSRQNRRGLDDHLIIRSYTLTLESETPKGRGERAHTGKTDQRPPRDRGIRPVPEDRYPVYILCLGKSPPISIKDTSLGIIG